MLGSYVDVIFKRFFRPFAAIGRTFPMLRCGPSMRPFVQSAAFCQLKCQFADKARIQCEKFE